jgi:predicted Zn-dependent protease with MMP-like domain
MSRNAVTDWNQLPAPSLEDIAALGQATFDALPALFRRRAGEVVFRVDDFASDEALEALGIEDAFQLSGLYHGVDIAHRSVLAPGGEISRVFLYRRPLLDEWAQRGDVTLGELITHVLVHEIAHHFGLSDADIEAIEARDP